MCTRVPGYVCVSRGKGRDERLDRPDVVDTWGGKAVTPSAFHQGSKDVCSWSCESSTTSGFWSLFHDWCKLLSVKCGSCRLPFSGWWEGLGGAECWRRVLFSVTFVFWGKLFLLGLVYFSFDSSPLALEAWVSWISQREPPITVTSHLWALFLPTAK